MKGMGSGNRSDRRIRNRKVGVSESQNIGMLGNQNEMTKQKPRGNRGFCFLK